MWTVSLRCGSSCESWDSSCMLNSFRTECRWNFSCLFFLVKRYFQSVTWHWFFHFWHVSPSPGLKWKLNRYIMNLKNQIEMWGEMSKVNLNVGATQGYDRFNAFLWIWTRHNDLQITNFKTLQTQTHVFPLYLTDTHESGGENKVLQ